MSSEIAQVWFEEAKKLTVGQALFVRVVDKKEQTTLANEFEEERRLFAQLEPVHASQIFINKVLKDRRQYVVLERKYRAPFTAFMRDDKGQFSKLIIDPERRRILTHASRADEGSLLLDSAADGGVMPRNLPGSGG